MLHHVSVGVRDVERAAQFYDAVLGALGYGRVMEVLPYAIGYGEVHPVFWVQLPHNQQVATAGNGVHISFIARTAEQVDAFHKAALELGAQDGGEPGPRPDYSPDYYGAFVYDPDGNKLEATLLPEEDAIEIAFADEIEEAPLTRKAAKKTAKKKTVKKAVKKAPAPKPATKKAAKPAIKKSAKKAAKKKVIKTIAVEAPPKPEKTGKKDKKSGKKDKKNKKDKKGKRK